VAVAAVAVAVAAGVGVGAGAANQVRTISTLITNSEFSTRNLKTHNPIS